MTKIRKLSVILTAALSSLAALCMLSGCLSDPAEAGTWYIESVTKDGVQYNLGDEFDGKTLYGDSWKWTFTEDKKVKIVALDESEVNGTYEVENRENPSATSYVTVTLENGTVFTGTCVYPFMFAVYDMYLSDGETDIALTSQARHTYQDYFAEQERQQARDRERGKLPIGERSNFGELYYLFGMTLDGKTYIVGDDYAESVLKTTYLVVDLRAEDFTAAFSDGTTIEEKYSSYEWSYSLATNYYYAATKEGEEFEFSYKAVGADGKINTVYIKNLKTGDEYVLLTKEGLSNSEVDSSLLPEEG